MTESDRHDALGDRAVPEGASASDEGFVPAYTPPPPRSGTESPLSRSGPDSSARGAAGRPAGDLQERVDSLTARNAKLLDTLKEA